MTSDHYPKTKYTDAVVFTSVYFILDVSWNHIANDTKYFKTENCNTWTKQNQLEALQWEGGG